MCGIVHVPVAHDELCFVNTKAGTGYCSTSLDSQIKTALLALSALSIRQRSQLLFNTDTSYIFAFLETVKILGNVSNTLISLSIT